MNTIKLREIYDKVEAKLNKRRDPVDVLGISVPAGTAARSLSKEKWEELFSKEMEILLSEGILECLDGVGSGDDKVYKIVHVENSIWNIFEKL